MRHWHDRNGHARHSPDLGREHATGIHDHVGADRVALSLPRRLDLYAGHAPSLHAHIHDSSVASDRGATAAGTRRQCQGESGRVEPAVGGQEDRTQHALGRHHREAVARLACRDQLERQPERLGPAGLPLELLIALASRSQAQRPDLVPGRIDARLLSKPSVQLDAVHHHPGQGHAGSELPDQPGGMECRTRGEVGPLDEDDVRPTELGEVVGDAGAAHTPTDDDRSCVVSHCASGPGRVAERALEGGP